MAAMRANMAQMSQMAAAGFKSSALALVTSYDPGHYAVKVKLQPPPAEGDAAETGWLPVWSPWIGQSWGFFSPPNVGDQVLVLFPGGDGQIGLVVGGIFSDVDKPLAVPAKEFWLQHSSGSFLKFTNDGKVAVHSVSDLSATVGGDLNATVTGKATLSASEFDLTGDLKVTGNINSTKTITATTAFKQGSTTLTVP